MKRIAVIVIMVLLGLGASARSIHYFTYSQAARTVNYLNTQKELMIYCGYEYEIETYVLINEVWMERVNSSYYEIWLYGYDAYTGDEIYMPIDLKCVWLYSAGRMYNAAQYLRFRVDVRLPSLVWRIPPYNPYTRIAHRPGYMRSYHYDIHRHGWMPPAYSHGPGMPPPPLPPYYMRRPNSPAPMPTNTWTPGAGRPEVSESAQPHHIGNTTTATNPSANSSSHQTSTTRNIGNKTSTPASSTRNNTTTTPTRNPSTTTPTRNTTTTTPTRNTTTTTPTRNTTTTTPTRNATTTPTRNTTTTTPTRNATTTPTRNATTTTPTRNATTTPTRNATTTTPTRNATTSPSRNATTTAPTRSSSPTRKTAER